jgi:carbonic anhydrase
MFPSTQFPDPTSPPLGAPAAPPATPGDPAAALAELRAGNLRFAAGTPSPSRTGRPVAAVLGCLDPRVPVEAVFDQGIGALCVVRSGGHVVDRAILGSLEFAVTDLGVPLVLVLGHDDCRAVATALDAARTGRRVPGARGFLIEEIAGAIVDRRAAEGTLERATRDHVRRTVSRVRDDLWATGRRVEVAGAVYHLDTGLVEFL